ncbi:hypothetical protein C2S52_008296 [Perilla frutescens var. hirtella]|nr:hypothetical protein C2S51_017971 [Perilla frutescens var. frutescens]KAH6783337.1 hypothetical protein C2S52_008296 [Perilla frutescens var. hirtella]
MSSAAGDMMFRCVFNGSLSMCDMNIERRPYHKNCQCALHEGKGECSHSGSQHRNISFPKRDFSSKCSLTALPASSSLSSQSSYVHSSSTRSNDASNRI